MRKVLDFKWIFIAAQQKGKDTNRFKSNTYEKFWNFPMIHAAKFFPAGDCGKVLR
jgi:hypothetical protein